MTARYQTRILYAQLLQRDLATSVLTKQAARLAGKALDHAVEDKASFERLFDEPVPEALRQAVTRECRAWGTVVTLLERARETPDRDSIESLHHELSTIVRVLDMEKEILYSPLRLYFFRQLEALP
jgi:hypothetical protein